MERLVTTAQAAQILGLSLQGVHYRIKKNQLKSLKKSGKTYVYISDHIEQRKSNEEPQIEIKEAPSNEIIQEIVKSKDEQITLLKKSIKWMRRQHNEELERIEKNHQSIISVFDREIDLLQSAFNEMRAIYKPQIQQVHSHNPYDGTKPFAKEEKPRFMALQEFTVYLKSNGKTDRDIKIIIFKAIKRRDKRFIYNKVDKKLLILNEDFSDLI